MLKNLSTWLQREEHIVILAMLMFFKENLIWPLIATSMWTYPDYYIVWFYLLLLLRLDIYVHHFLQLKEFYHGQVACICKFHQGVSKNSNFGNWLRLWNCHHDMYINEKFLNVVYLPSCLGKHKCLVCLNNHPFLSSS